MTPILRPDVLIRPGPSPGPPNPAPAPAPPARHRAPGPFMVAVGRFVVRHRTAGVVFLFLVALAGVAMVGNVTSRLSSSENLPGIPSYAVSQAILHVYGTGGDNPPDVMVLRLSPGQRAQSAAGRAELDAALAPLTGDNAVRVVSYANSGDGRLVSANGRDAIALVFGGNDEPTSYNLAARVRAAGPARGSV